MATTLIQNEPVIDTSVVRVTNFHKGYRTWFRWREAVRGVDLTVERGEIFGLIGPDGAGKSSLMKAIAGVLTYDDGEVNVFGKRINSERTAERVKDRIGFMPQGLGQNLYPTLSVEENIDFFAELRLVSKDELAERKNKFLAMTRLDKFRTRPMKNLSGGMKQKLGLVCALIHQPQLVILDEPTTGVDPVSRRDFWAILSELLREQGMTALVSTAYLDEATRFHRVAMMHQGRFLDSGKPDELVDKTPGSVVVVRARPQLVAFELLARCFRQTEAVGHNIRVFARDVSADEARAKITELLADVEIIELNVYDHELEDVFIAMLDDGTKLPVPSSGRKHGANPAAGSPHQDSHDRGNLSTNEIAVEANGLVKQFGSFRAVDNVSFNIRQGEIYGLLGANGAGKTTVIKMLNGILRPTSGTGRVAGADMRAGGYDIKQRIGYVSQAFSLYSDLSVVDNIQLYGGIYGLNRRQKRDRTEWVLEMGGLHGHESDLAGQLPMGLRQRLALGCALVHGPKIIFLDEPTSGVDPIGRRQFWETLFRLSREELVTILVTTHYMSEAEHCDRLGLMYAGRLVDDASPDELKERTSAEAGTLLSIHTEQPLATVAVLENANLSDPTLFGNRVHVLCKDAECEHARIEKLLAAANIQVKSIRPIPMSLEDVFVYRVLSLEKENDGKQ